MFDIPPLLPDTAANRSGQFTDWQRQRLRNNLWGLGLWTILFLGIAALMLIIVVMGLLSAQTAGSDSGAWHSAFFLFIGAPSLGLLAVAAQFGFKFIITWQDVSEGRIEQGDGEAAWGGSNYRAEVTGRKLSWPDLSLAPGPYRFYYLPRTGRVLSAEKLAPGARGTADDELRAALAQANKFKLGALADMRAGRIGAARGDLVRSAWVAPGLTTVFMGGFLAFVRWAISINNNGASWAFLLVLAFVALIIVAGMAWGAVNVTRDALADKVLTAQGVVRREILRGKYVSFYYRLDRLSFNIGAAAYNALVDGRVYRLYYLPHAEKLVGIEPAE